MMEITSLPQCRDEIEPLIPHKGTMCVLERVLFCDQHLIRCETNSHQQSDNPLRNERGLPVSAAIEYAAQAIALQGGLLSATAEPPKNGYLAVLSGVKWQVEWLHEINSALVVEVRRDTQLTGGINCDFLVSSDDRLLLEGSALVAFME